MCHPLYYIKAIYLYLCDYSEGEKTTETTPQGTGKGRRITTV